MKTKIDIGLDIGIASVGWAIVNHDTLEIIKHGSRLFETMDNHKDGKLENVNRREARSARRQKNRRLTLRRDFVKLLIDSKIINDIQFDKNGKVMVQNFVDKYINTTNKKIKNQTMKTFELRKNALSSKLETKDLVSVLYWYLNHRGFKYQEVKDDEKEDKSESLLSSYKKLAADELPVNVQLKFYEDNGHINGTLNRIFSHSQYESELSQILKNQKVDNTFQDKYMTLFDRQRSFEEGPGSVEIFNKVSEQTKLKLLSEMRNSRFSLENGKLKVASSMWEKSIGKCSIFKDENRAPKHSLTAEAFNLLDDLNNITVVGEKLSKEQKIEILKISVLKKTNSNEIIKYLKKEFDFEDLSLLSGYKLDDKNNPKFYELGSVHAIKKAHTYTFDELFDENGLIENNPIDKIVDVLNGSKLQEKRVERIKELNLRLNDDEINAISKIKNTPEVSFVQNHSLSYKAMRQLIPFMLNEPKNQMQLIHENGLFESKIKFEKSKYISKVWIDEVIDTPTVKRALRESINIINEAIKQSSKYDWEINAIVVEMARENNNKSKRDSIKNRQKYFEQFNAQLKKYAVGDEDNLNNRVRLKLWLLEQQNGKDAYDGQPISKSDVISNPGKYDIDHIIPYSLTFDDSRDNKVLTKQQLNHLKGQRTAWEFIGRDNSVKDVTWEKMCELWKSWYVSPAKEKMIFASRDKINFLTSRLDFNKAENQFGFIQRNLVDTRYTTRALINALDSFKRANELDIKIRTINGKMTNFARRSMENSVNKVKLNRPEDIGVEQWNDVTKEKDRTWNGHHAEDAYIVTVINKMYGESKIVEKIISDPKIKLGKLETYHERLNYMNISANHEELMFAFDKARIELNSKMDKVLFSRKVISKTNVELSNETLYEAKINADGTLQKIARLKLATLDNKKATEYFGVAEISAIKEAKTKTTKKSKDLLIDKNLYDELQKIYNNNKGEDFPFAKALNGNKYIEVTHKTKSGNLVTRKVEAIRIVQQNNKNTDEVLVAGNNGNSFYETLNWTKLEIHKNDKGKFKIVPISARFAWFGNNSDEIKYKPSYQKYLKINNLVEYVGDLKKGDILINPEKPNEKFYVVGHKYKSDKIELNTVWKNTPDRFIFSINTAVTGWEKINTNQFGETKSKLKMF